MIEPKTRPTRDLSIDCIHLGQMLDRQDDDGNMRNCRGCWLFACAKHQTCAITYQRKDAVGRCLTCNDYEAE